MEAQQQKKMQVIFADDDSDDYLLFNEALQQTALPIEVVWAEDGKKLMNILESGNIPDLLFLDVNMPNKNGIECLNEIRANPKYASLPIVIYSTTNYRVNIDACYKNGANLFVIKPGSFEEIIQLIQKLCTPEWTSTASALPPEYFVYNSV